ncbi:AbrB family transcriptional regulator [Enterococcus gallinarum]|uniref:AbrB family transcriptional regulator n=1 Tax=Enterococcus gallinarum TaxID=1353 RepID=UPI001F598999|nr:AbrB family transcriptional regulator [Enterococcus gallinarum]MCR1932240.1 AbrB family transcriptional regulator [Enterococcus gallinarum]
MVVKIIETLIVGLIGGIIARRIKMPAPFMTGSMLAVAFFSMFTDQMYMANNLKIFAQIISGAYIGQQVSKKDLLNFPKLGKSILLLMAFFTFNLFTMGFLFHSFFSLDLITALLCCMPGGIMDVSLISIDMGAEAEVVATMQLARLVGMLLILPYWISFLLERLEKKNGISIETTENKTKMKRELTIGINNPFINDCTILIVAGLGGILGLYFQIPVGALMFSLLFSCGLKILKNTAQLNNNIRYIAQIFAGAIIGSTFNRDSLSQLGRLLIPAVLLLLSYLIINVLFGYIVYKRGILDLKSALFASSPAGATDISLIAGELGGEMPKIAAIQICRTLYTIMVLPNLIRWLT